MEKIDIVNKIEALRKQKGVSGREFSRAIGRDPSYLSNILSSENMPSLYVIEECCNYLGITLEEFFREDFIKGPSDQYLLKRINEITDEKGKAELIQILNALDKKSFQTLLTFMQNYKEGKIMF